MVEPVDAYRMYAETAADMAVDETDPGRRASLLEMAQAWRRLADKVAGSHRVTQQQQQPQPGSSGSSASVNAPTQA